MEPALGFGRDRGSDGTGQRARSLRAREARRPGLQTQPTRQFDGGAIAESQDVKEPQCGLNAPEHTADAPEAPDAGVATAR